MKPMPTPAPSRILRILACAAGMWLTGRIVYSLLPGTKFPPIDKVAEYWPFLIKIAAWVRV